MGKKLAVLGALAGVPLVAGALAGCSTGSGGVAQPALEQSCVDELPVDDWSWVASEAFRSGEAVRVAAVGYDLRGDAVEATVECTDGYVSSSGAVDASSREAPLTAGLVGCAQSRDADGRWVSFEGKLWANTSGELGGDRLCRLEGIDSLGPGPADAFFEVGVPLRLSAAGPAELREIVQEGDGDGLVAQCLLGLPFAGPVLVEDLIMLDGGAGQARTVAAVTLVDAAGSRECRIDYGGRSDLDYRLSQ